MLDDIAITTLLGLVVLAAPAALVMVLGLTSLVNRPLHEASIARLVQSATVIGLATSAAILAIMLIDGTRHLPIELGHWVAIPHYHFSITLIFDRLSVPFAILTFLLCGTIGAFGSRYLHREPGFNRFFTFFALFELGMTLASLAGTIETLFIGWELVGIASALLVAFFQERAAPVRNGLWVWVVYRISDAALLVAAVVLHHWQGEGDFAALLGTDWPSGQASLAPWQALLVGLLFLLAAAGKSALAPFSGWLPRAMEGPTPSSAIFYGALSVHLGAFLLLRVSPILDASTWLCAIIVALGLATAVLAALAGRVQSDIKSALSFASLTQVGIIVVEIGLGLRYLALVHILGHACLRTLQFLRAPTLLHDYHQLENAIGGRLPRLPAAVRLLVPPRARDWFYRLALERGYLDAVLADYVARPFLACFVWCDRAERRWTDWLAGWPSVDEQRSASSAESLEDLL
jgi:NAD(P)H-quinone oxidoreductase subunit 5